MTIDVVGYGLCTGLGNTVAENWRAVVGGAVSHRPITRFPAEDFPQSSGGVLTEEAEETLTTAHDQDSPAMAMILQAGNEAMTGLPDAATSNCGLVMASNFGLMGYREWCWRERIETGEMDAETFEVQQTIATRVASSYGISGPVAHLSLSCASGAAAVSLARHWLTTSRCNHCLVICYDEITEFIWCGLSNLRTITTDTLRPFNKERSGTIFGEGAGALLLSSASEAPRLATLAGSATNNNAFHMTAPSKDADGSRRVMAAALASAGLPPGEVDIVCAHATGTSANDVTEASAINNLLNGRKVPVLAFKSNIGHLMGAAGIAEAVLTICALNDGVLPKIAGTREKDPQCDVDAVLHENRAVNAEVAITNSAGLGGNNASLVLTTREWNAPKVPTRAVALANLGWVLPGSVGSGSALPSIEPDELISRNSELAGFSPKEYVSSVKGYLDPVAAFSLAAAALALKECPVADPSRTAVISATQYGAGLSGFRFMDAMVQKGHRFASPMVFPHSYANTAGNLVAIEFSLAGEHFVFDLASDAAEAFRLAIGLIETGAADDALLIVNEGAPPETLPDGQALLHGAICARLSTGAGPCPSTAPMPDNRQGTVYAMLKGFSAS